MGSHRENSRRMDVHQIARLNWLRADQPKGTRDYNTTNTKVAFRREDIKRFAD